MIFCRFCFNCFSAVDFSEQEILDVIHESSENSSFLRKDTVFARMSFALKTGSFRLVENLIGETGIDYYLCYFSYCDSSLFIIALLSIST